MNKPLIQLISSLFIASMLCTPMVGFAASTPDTAKTATTAKTTTTASASATAFASKIYPFSKIKSTIKAYKAENKDIVGWLTIPNTNINEPVAFSNQNNNYYVYRDWRGKNYPNTTYKNFVQNVTYADFRTIFAPTWAESSRNLVLYGHNWTNLKSPLDIGSNNNHIMFGQLPSYTSMQFAKDNPYIYFSTGEKEGVWKVFAVAYCEQKPSFFYNNPNPQKATFQKLIDEWKARSMYDFDVEVDSSDRIITLSTCTRQYNVGENQRFVVVARLLREGETDTKKVTVAANADMKQPQF